MRIALCALAVLSAAGSWASDAADFGFSPDATGRENTAALQRAFDAGGTVRAQSNPHHHLRPFNVQRFRRRSASRK